MSDLRHANDEHISELNSQLESMDEAHRSLRATTAAATSVREQRFRVDINPGGTRSQVASAAASAAAKAAAAAAAEAAKDTLAAQKAELEVG